MSSQRPAMGNVLNVLDYETYGGAPLLGVGVGIICHGASPAKAIKNAIRSRRSGGAQPILDGTCRRVAEGKVPREATVRRAVGGTGSYAPPRV